MRGLLCAVILAVVALPARATTSEEVEVTCLVCGNKFKAEDWSSTNSVGGQDRDFLEHAAGGQVFLLSCWSCPKCHYTGYPNYFDAGDVPAGIVERLKKENPLRPAAPVDPKVEHTGEIPGWVRYDLWLQVLQLQEDVTPLQQALIHLRAAQTQRFEWTCLEPLDKRTDALWDLAKEGGIPDDGYERDMEMGRRFEKLAADEKSGLAAEDRPLARAFAAVQYKSRGEDLEAARVVAALAGVELEPAVRAVVDDVRTRIDREREYRGRALPWFEKALAEPGLEPKRAMNLHYLTGVLLRRQGENKEALAHLEPLMATEGLPDGFRAWIEDEIAKAKAGG